MLRVAFPAGMRHSVGNTPEVSLKPPATAGGFFIPKTPATPSHTQPPTDGLRGVTGRPGPRSLVRLSPRPLSRATQTTPEGAPCMAAEHCAVCDKPMVRRRGVWVCTRCDMYRWER